MSDAPIPADRAVLPSARPSPTPPPSRESAAAVEAEDPLPPDLAKALRGVTTTPSPGVTSRAQASVIRAVFAAESAELVSAHLEDGTCVWASDSAAPLFEWTVEELVGHTPASFYHPDDWQRMGEVDPLLDPPAAPTEVRFRTSDGSYRWVESRATLASVSGVARTVRFTRDITARVSRDLEIEEVARLLEQLMRHSAEAEFPSEVELLRLCAWCKCVGDDWMPLERFLESVTHRDITHGICPACVGELDRETPASRAPPDAPGSES